MNDILELIILNVGLVLSIFSLITVGFLFRVRRVVFQKSKEFYFLLILVLNLFGISYVFFMENLGGNFQFVWSYFNYKFIVFVFSLIYFYIRPNFFSKWFKISFSINYCFILIFESGFFVYSFLGEIFRLFFKLSIFVICYFGILEGLHKKMDLSKMKKLCNNK